jgi:hypothetical protein
MPNGRRQSVDIEAVDAHAAFAVLPPYENHKYVVYTDTNMKHAPKWSEAAHYRQTIFRLLQASGGKSINQVSLLAHFKAWLSPAPVDLKQAEEAVYFLRCMINQLINHKCRQRQPPREMQRPFGSIWTLIDGDADNDGNDGSEDEGLEIVSVREAPEQPETIDLDCVCDILDDPDPELNALLHQGSDSVQDLPRVLQDDDPELHDLLNNIGEDCSSAPELFIRGMGQ